MVTSDYPTEFGFKGIGSSAHTSRTLMLAELSTLFDHESGSSPRRSYLRAIVEENVLAKSTESTRKLTAQRLSELYILDPAVEMFRVFRSLWSREDQSHGLLALLMALTRDSLLRASCSVILKLENGTELSRQTLVKALLEASSGRLNERIADKVARNVASSWTQSGHLMGRVRKVRARCVPTPATITFALYLGWLQGGRGSQLFKSEWMRVFDVGLGELQQAAIQANQLRFIDAKFGGDISEISFPRELTSATLTQEARV